MELFVKTNQGAFDRACRRLFNGKGRCYDSKFGGCMYRSPDGNKCVVGDMFPNKFYNEEMEGKNWGALSADLNYTGKVSRDLLNSLQSIHDLKTYWDGNNPSHKGIERLYHLATTWELNTKVLDKLVKS